MKIEALKKKEDKEPLNNNSHIIKHKFRLGLVGASGSGKTNLLITMLISPEFFGGYFHRIVLVTPNFEQDNNYEHLEDFVTTHKFKEKGGKFLKNKNLSKKIKLDVMPAFNEGEAEEIVASIKKDLKEAKKNKGERPRTIVILDDVLEDTKLLNSSFLSLCFTRSRHLNCSVIFSSQSFKSIPRKCRLNCSNFILFEPRNKGEKDKIFEEIISGLDKNEFYDLCKVVFDAKYNFLHINQSNDKDKKYMKNFDGYITL